MSTLRSHIIRLAHQKPELRPHLLPLVARTAGNMGEALMDHEADRAGERAEAIKAMVLVMEKTLNLVQNLHPSATRRFDSFYGKIIKEGMALVSSANKLLKYTDEMDPQGEGEEDFVATRRMLQISINDWQKNLSRAMAGSKMIAAMKLIEAQQAAGFALKVADWIQNLARMDLV
jgi:protein-tyrosine-phosphatase